MPGYTAIMQRGFVVWLTIMCPRVLQDIYLEILQHFPCGKDVFRMTTTQCWPTTKGEVKSGSPRRGRLQGICGFWPKRNFAMWKVPTSLTFKTSMLMSFVADTGDWHLHLDIMSQNYPQHGWMGVDLFASNQSTDCLLYLSLNHHNNPPPRMDTWCKCSTSK